MKIKYSMNLFRQLIKEKLKSSVKSHKKFELKHFDRAKLNKSDKIVNTSLTMFGISIIAIYSGYLSYKLLKLIKEVRENTNNSKECKKKIFRMKKI